MLVYHTCAQWYAHITYKQFLHVTVGVGLGLGLMFVLHIFLH